MAVTAFLYTAFFAKALNKEIDYDTDTIKMMLVTSSYTPDRDNHDYKNDITNEIAGTGYTAGGVTLGSKTITLDAAGHAYKFDAADPSWPGATFTTRRAIAYVDTGNAATSALIGYIDFGQDESVAGAEFKIQLHADGLFKLAGV